MESPHALIGSWKLLSFELESTDGTISYPYGEDLIGYLFYNEDGFMSSAFMNAARGQVAGSDLEAASQASTYDQFMSYCGGFRINGDKISHRVEVSSLEVWIGTIQERWFKVDGDRLELLTAPLEVGSDAPVGRLIWERSTQAVLPA